MDKRMDITLNPGARSGRTLGHKRKTTIKGDFLQNILDSISDMIVLIDQAGRLIYSSPSTVNLIGINPVRLQGRTIFELVHAGDYERVRNALKLSTEPGEVTTCEFRIRHANGNAVWVEMRSQRSDRSSDDEVVAILRDIGRRHHQEVLADEEKHHLEDEVEARNRQLEMTVELLKKQNDAHVRDQEALEQSELRYTTLVENTLTGIYIHDGRKMIFCNERFAQIFGFDRDYAESINTHELFMGGRSVETLLSDMAQDELVEGKTCDGKCIWLKMSRARIVYNGLQMVIGNVIDITEQIIINERLKASEVELHALSAQLMAAQESERKRIANELHDGLGQRLSAIKFAVENVWRSTDIDLFPEQSRRLGGVVNSIRDAIEEVRRVSMDLRPSILDDLGLIATIGWFCREFSLLFPVIGVNRTITANECDIPEEVKVVIFRIIQEAFHNITKHAQADQIDLELICYNNNLQLMIRDNGCGINSLDDSPCCKGLGMKTMRERAELSHGEFRVDSVVGRGTMISVQWPRTLN